MIEESNNFRNMNLLELLSYWGFLRHNLPITFGAPLDPTRCLVYDQMDIPLVWNPGR